MWIRADLAPPCTIVADFNTEEGCLPFHSHCFDIVICTEVLEHLLWPQRLLTECHRVLSAQGCMVISVPNMVSLTYRFAWLMGRIPSCAAGGNMPFEMVRTSYQKESGGYVAGHVVDFNRERLSCLLESCGFKMTCTKGSGIFWHRQILPHWLVPTNLASNIICLAKKISTQSRAF